MKHVYSLLLVLMALVIAPPSVSAQSYDLSTDDGLCLKLTSASSDTIEASVVGITLKQEGADLTITPLIEYMGLPIKIVDVAITLSPTTKVGNKLTILPGMNVSSLKTAPFRCFDIPDNIGLSGIYEGNAFIQSVSFPPGIKTIPANAFNNCTSLQSITLPPSVTEIGSSSFRSCQGLKRIDGLQNVTTVKGSAFSQCISLDSVHFSAALTYLGPYSFYFCKSLTSISIGSIDTIRAGTFTSSGIKSLDFLSEVKHFESYSLEGLENLENAILPNGLDSMPDNLISGDNIRYIKFGDNIKTIVNDAFSTHDPYNPVASTGVIGYLGKLQKIDFNKVEYIGMRAFWSPNLRSVTLPPSVKTAFTSSFSSCFNVTIEDGHEPLSFHRGSLTGGFSGDIYLGRSLTGDAFTPNSFTDQNYDYETLYNKSPFGRVKSLTLGDLVMRLPGYTFDLYSASDLRLPKNLRFIGKNCFASVLNDELIIPAHLDSIGAQAFGEMPNLRKLISYAATPPVCDSTVFTTVHYLFTRLEVPDAEAYRNAPVWKNFRNIVTSGIDDPLADPSAPAISVEEGAIKVSGSEQAEVFTPDGRLVYRGSPAAIPALPRGIYIVRAGSAAVKLSL